MSDPHKWEFRPPPREEVGGPLELCQEREACRLADNCPAAHSLQELREWKARRELIVKEYSKGSTYSDMILKEVLNNQSWFPPTVTAVPDVELTCDQKDRVTFNNRNSSTAWNISLKSKHFLKGVSLLHVENLQHFSLTDVRRIRDGNTQAFNSTERECVLEGSSSSAKDAEQVSSYQYSLKLKFHTKVFGTFKQTVVFDFGTKPLLSKSVHVLVSPSDREDDLRAARESILVLSDVWDESNCQLVRFDPPPRLRQLDEEQLLGEYPIPQPSTFQLTQAAVEPALTSENYRERFHQLLYLEEISQYEEITGFHVVLSLQITERYLLSASPANSSTAKYTRPGELFGRIELSSELSDESKAGKLILNKCQTVLLRVTAMEADKSRKGRKKVEKKKKNSIADNKTWECLIEDTAKSVLYVRLPASMVLELGLKTDTKLRAEIQFRLSRLSLVEMHYAIDRLADLETVYPDCDQVAPIPWSPATHWKDSIDPKLNLKQKEAVLAISAPLSVILPPILIIGPYGTGKTYTLGKAIELLLQETESRILVCTHSNSAADLYIKEYVDPAVVCGALKKAVVRVYYYNRWVHTVHATVQKYCLIETEELTATRRFREPVYEDLVGKDLVVATLSTSRILAKLLPRGYFTHILLDEAAQALETEAIMPLILAKKETRVVLAGDHMQLEPEVVSPLAQEKRLNLSLLERLYDHYPKNFPCTILLCENYRSHEEIVNFTSDLFYEQKLYASGKQPAHPKWFPLTFFTARGEDVQDVNSTSYYNNYEVGEIVDRLLELRKHWPRTWGKKEDVEVGVVTPYHDQVMRIRSELRKKRLHNVSVERVQNVQGKQYRVIFISTVRTRESCCKPDNKKTNFGFLSSAKLLNTAITRAQSLVAVVGDPVALCSVGRCRKLWEKYIESCHRNGSLIGYTWQELKSNLEAIELKNIYGLNPLAKEFFPKAMGAPLWKTNFSYDAVYSTAPLPPPSPRLAATMGLLPHKPPPPASYPGLPLVYPTPLPPAHHFAAAGFIAPQTFHPHPLGHPLFPASRAMLPAAAALGLPPPLSLAAAAAMSATGQLGFRPPNLTPATTIREGVKLTDPGAIQRILPPGTDFITLLTSRPAQRAWHSFLVSVGRDSDATAFEDLMLTSEGAAALAQLQQQHHAGMPQHQPDPHLFNYNVHEQGAAGPGASADRAGWVRSSTPPRRPTQLVNGCEAVSDEEEEEDTMTVLLKSIMADLEGTKGQPSEEPADSGLVEGIMADLEGLKPLSADNVPLYMRRGMSQRRTTEEEAESVRAASQMVPHCDSILPSSHHYQQPPHDSVLQFMAGGGLLMPDLYSGWAHHQHHQIHRSDFITGGGGGLHAGGRFHEAMMRPFDAADMVQGSTSPNGFHEEEENAGHGLHTGGTLAGRIEDGLPMGAGRTGRDIRPNLGEDEFPSLASAVNGSASNPFPRFPGGGAELHSAASSPVVYQQSYAGVLRTTFASAVDPDPDGVDTLTRIRNLGTMGSRV